MSAPAAKARSLPVTIMQRTWWPRSQLSSASASSFSKAVFSAFSASGRLSVAIPTAPCTSVFMFMSLSRLAFGTIEAGPAGLDNALHCPFASQFARLAFAAIDQEVMLEIAGVAGGLGMVAQGGSAGGDGVFQHFLDGGNQGRDALLFDGACKPPGRNASAQQGLADIDIAQSRDQPLIQQRRFDGSLFA